MKQNATQNRGSVTFSVKDSGVVVDIATRIPTHHKNWQSVTYKGKRYQLFGGNQLFGGIRNELWINLNRAIPLDSLS